VIISVKTKAFKKNYFFGKNDFWSGRYAAGASVGSKKEWKQNKKASPYDTEKNLLVSMWTL